MEEEIQHYLGKRLLQDSANKETVAAYLRELSKKELIDLFLSFMDSQEGEKIPLSIFRTKRLGALETLTYYLKTYRNMKNTQIAKLLGRTPQAIWTTLHHAQRKMDDELTLERSEYDIPLDALRQGVSILENITLYLKEVQGLRFTDIAGLLQRNPRTIWTTYRRAKEKEE